MVDGAAGDNVGQRQVDARSAAGRAALADPPAAAPADTHTADGRWPLRPPPPAATPPGGGGRPRRARGGGGRHLLWALGALVRRRRRHRATHEHVAVFRGLTSPSSASTSSRSTTTPASPSPTSPRPPAAGCAAASPPTTPQDADRILAALRDQRLPLCPTARARPTAPPRHRRRPRTTAPGPRRPRRRRRRPRPRPPARRPAPRRPPRPDDVGPDDRHVVRAGGGLPGGEVMAGTDHRSRALAPTARRPRGAAPRPLLLGFAVLITVVAQCIVDLTITGSLRPGAGHVRPVDHRAVGGRAPRRPASGPPTPTRCCCRPWRCSSASAWPSSTGSTSPASRSAAPPPARTPPSS